MTMNVFLASENGFAGFCYETIVNPNSKMSPIQFRQTMIPKEWLLMR